MKALLKIAAAGVAAIVVIIAATNGSAQPSPDSEYADLARQIARLFWTKSDDARRTEEYRVEMQIMEAAPAPFRVGAAPRRGRQLQSSYEVGLRAVAGRSRTSLAQALAASMTADELRATLAFFSSRGGRAALRARSEHSERMRAFIRGPDRGEEPLPDFPAYAPNSAEREFMDSPAGKAFEAAIAAENRDSLQRVIEAAEDDYCWQSPCSAENRQFFRGMLARVNPRRARGEHALLGHTAGDLFPDASIAALARAACTGDSEAVTAAVQSGSDPNAFAATAVRRRGTGIIVTALLWAIDCGNLIGVDALLKAGADPNQIEQFGETPVTFAADNRDPAILQLLLRSGGDPNAQDGEYTALEIAMRAGGAFETWEGLPKSRAWANWDALLAAGADPDRVAPEGRPLIEAAALFGMFETVEWFLNRGWNGDVEDLGRRLEIAKTSGSINPEQRAALQRVKVQLAARGVHID